jgi:hypothetical protein
MQTDGVRRRRQQSRPQHSTTTPHTVNTSQNCNSSRAAHGATSGARSANVIQPHSATDTARPRGVLRRDAAAGRTEVTPRIRRRQRHHDGGASRSAHCANLLYTNAEIHSNGGLKRPRARAGVRGRHKRTPTGFYRCRSELVRRSAPSRGAFPAVYSGCMWRLYTAGR